MKKVALFYHSGSGNHGCEAIVRSTLKILGIKCDLYSNCPVEDENMGLNDICFVHSDSATIRRGSIAYCKALFRSKFLHDKQAFDLLHFSPLINAIAETDVVLSIGGDMYCYGINDYIIMINEEIRKKGKPCVLWGCSVEPEAMYGRVLDDLKRYSHIVARESITYNALIDKGVTRVSLCPDPAFLLDRVDLPLPDEFIMGNTVGINVSPMVIDYEKNTGMTIENYMCLMRYILNETDMNVALIPHVVWDRTDDRKPLSLLYNSFKETRRVCMIENNNAEVLKGYIARCRFMVAARTHASIAAYSSQVPTLVVGYSVKARGIARDIFGNENDYVIPVQDIVSDSVLCDKFQKIVEKEDYIRKHYAHIMGKYINDVWKMKEPILKLRDV